MDTVKYLQHRYVFKNWELVNKEDFEHETIEYFDCTFNNEKVELKVSSDKTGHWTTFKVHKRLKGNEEWNYFDTFEKYID
ncbi:hypothetical protein CON01_01020 [Bacillus thuringiensis]|uniref:Uncharacterized protein n=1 Tax=Bacillus thuringiensis TaxID=1428 RepID=A0A9X6U5I6_BACTU|nr:hypothetical protein [Bacillus thuringiensis]PED16463.1 hypothetical protein CON01_01020 [Bacillus thuringiensis]PGO85225.1 hypothetical protein CN990_21310 [Bacillus thuringiensis]